jgi:hypothetical protein
MRLKLTVIGALAAAGLAAGLLAGVASATYRHEQRQARVRH